MGVNSLGMTLDENDSINLWPSRSEEWACVSIGDDGISYDLRFGRKHLEKLRDQISNALAGLDRVAAEDAACEQAETACERAMDAATTALIRAQAAEAAGAHDVAASLREYAEKASAAARAVDAAVRGFGHAAEAADSATESLIYVTHQADGALRRLRTDGQPDELATA